MSGREASHGIEAQQVAPTPAGLRFSTAVLLALAAGLLLRLWFLLHNEHLAGDSLIYGDFAKNLLQHGVYGFSDTAHGLPAPPRPTLIRLPGYPLFLALIFALFGVEHYRAAMLVQVAIDLWTCLLLGGLAGRIFTQNRRRAACAALWLAALCPFTANYVAAPLTETLTLFTIALAFYSLERWRQESDSGLNRWMFAIAFALGYGILLRPEQGMLAAAVVPAMAWMRLRGARNRSALVALRPVLLLSLLAVLPLLPWTLRNWRTMHVFQPLAPRYANDPGESNPYGFQHWYRTWAVDFASTVTVYWNYEGSSLQIADLPNRAFDSDAEYTATETLLADYNQNNTRSDTLDRRFDALARQRVQADPIRYFVQLPGSRLVNMMFRPRTEMLPVPLEWWKYRGHEHTALFAGFYAVLNLVYFVLAGITMRRRELWRDYQPLVWAMLATIVMRSALLLTMDNSEARYTLEFFPILIVLAAGCFIPFRRADNRGDNAEILTAPQ